MKFAHVFDRTYRHDQTFYSFCVHISQSVCLSWNRMLRNNFWFHISKYTQVRKKYILFQTRFFCCFSYIIAMVPTAIHEPSARYYQLFCLYRRRWRKRRKIEVWVKDHQILPFLEVWRRQVQFSGKYQNCHLVLKGSFWFFLVLFLVLFSSAFCSFVLFQFCYWFFLVLLLVLQFFFSFSISSSSSLRITKI